MMGYRKLIMFTLVGAIVAFIPLTPTNGGVLETLIIVAIGGNAIEHLGGVHEKLAAWRASRNRSGAGDPAGAEEGRPEED
jgi:hypothetical protein